MTEWVAWVDVLDDGPGDETDGESARARYYVTHGIPFLQLTPFRSAAARYGSADVATQIAEFAADGDAPRGAEEIPPRLPIQTPRST